MMQHKLIIVLSMMILISCSSRLPDQTLITISGSDTMFELTSNLAAEFMKRNPGISINVLGGGTATGINDLIKGKTDICTASRNLKPLEAKELADYYNSLGLVYLITKDGLSIYLNPSNNIKNLTIDQVKDIFIGRINNWKTLGGKDTIIIPVIRNPNSGTHLYFKEHILDNKEYPNSCLIESTTKDIVKFVSENTNAIGYGGMGYSNNVLSASIDGVDPTEKNIINDSYPLSRYLHFFTAKNPNGIVKQFIDWVLSPDAQAIIRKSGYIPLWESSQTGSAFNN